jgi:hypothetical protein
MVIIFAQDNGVLGRLVPAPQFLEQLTGTEEEKLLHIGHKDLATGTLFELVEDDYVPSDWSFRNAWEYVSGENEQVSEDLSLDDQLKYNTITQEEYDASNG